MLVSRYRENGHGPEHLLEQALIESLEALFGSDQGDWWLAASFPVGASRPDILLASYEPLIHALSEASSIHFDILSYLYCVRRARPETISSRIGKPISTVLDAVDFLGQLEVTKYYAHSYSLNSVWRSILPRVVSIEVKVKNWRRAIQQAKLNLAFAHETYIAMPGGIARRVANKPEIKSSGLGVISIEEEKVAIMRDPIWSEPSVPSYQFKIAGAIADSR